jgi:hypothetical protein
MIIESIVAAVFILSSPLSRDFILMIIVRLFSETLMNFSLFCIMKENLKLEKSLKVDKVEIKNLLERKTETFTLRL